MKTSMACLALLATFGAAGARADDPAKAADPPKAESAAKPAAPGQQKQIDKLAAEFSVTKEQVTALRTQGLGWGEIRHALTLSSKTGKPVEDILKMRKDGIGWGEIANKEGVKLGPDRSGKGSESRGERGAGGDHGVGREHGGGRVK
jgi:hypothetical protein